MTALPTLAFAVILAFSVDSSSPSAVPEIKFADLKSAIETENLNRVKDAGGKFGGFVVTDIPAVGYTDAVEDLVRYLYLDSFSRLTNRRFQLTNSSDEICVANVAIHYF